MSKARIAYGDVAVGAKESFAPTAKDQLSFSKVDQIKKSLFFPNYANPCELYNVALDGQSLPLLSDMGRENIGWWSNQITDDGGVFSTPLVLTLISSELFTSSGLMLTFDKYNNIYPTEINVKWYRRGELISDMYFEPNSAYYFCSNKVQYYDRVTITIYSLNMPYTRLKMRDIDYGLGVEFSGKELRRLKIIQEIDPISSQMSINTADFTVDVDDGIEYSFQARQPLSIFFGDDLKATAFVSSAKRKTKTQWDIRGEDYIGLLDTITFSGGIYNEANAVELLTEIFELAKVPFTIDPIFDQETITGYIPYTTCREALMQIAFAIGAVVDTSERMDIRVYAMNENDGIYIPLNRVFQGQNFDEQSTVTAVEVTSHTYKKSTTQTTAYDAKESGSGNGITVIFSEPLHSLSITSGSIIESGTNYAVINANSGCVLKGYKYEHEQTLARKQNPMVLKTDIENIKSVKNATLVSRHNVDKVLERCYNYLASAESINLKTVERSYGTAKYGDAVYGNSRYSGSGKTLVGDFVTMQTEYKGDKKGVIVKQTYSLSGNIIVKDSTVKEVL